MDKVEQARSLARCLKKDAQGYLKAQNLHGIQLYEDKQHIEGYLPYNVTGDRKIDRWMIALFKAKNLDVVVSEPSKYLNELIFNETFIKIPPQEPVKALGFSFTYVDNDTETTIDMISDCNVNEKKYEEEFKSAKEMCDLNPGSYIKSGDNIIYKGKIAELMDLPLESFIDMKVDSELFKKLNHDE